LLRERGSRSRVLLEQFLSDRGIAAATHTLGTNTALIRAVSAGLGVTLISRSLVQAELDAGSVAEIRLADGPPPRSWYLVRSSVGPDRPLVDDFIVFALALLPVRHGRDGGRLGPRQGAIGVGA
jgi:DNA-binding transcriptional LysR family regulator